MHFDTSFSGRVVQVTEALSYDDAVSNQITALDGLLQRMGLRSAVYTKWHDPRLEAARRSIDELEVDDRDIVVYHFYGFAGHTLPAVADLYCTRVLIYHNITPHDFFEEGSSLHGFCLQGREQLRQFLPRFHRCWGDSQYNLEELIGLGAAREHCAVVPILVTEPAPSGIGAMPRRPGCWLFVGRIAANKDQLGLVRLFESVRATHPHCAQELLLAGGFDPHDPFYQSLARAVEASECRTRIRLLGKVSNTERDSLYREASVFVSASQHEGFGVPLIEAGLHGLPALALRHAAVPETLAVPEALADGMTALHDLVIRVAEDDAFGDSLLLRQATNARRFGPAAVQTALRQALASVLPRRQQFQTLSVVICTLNRRDYLSRVLEYLTHQWSRAIEVIVVDGPSSDGTSELIASYEGRIKVGRNPERNLSVSRNIGIELARGDVIAFIDDDALPFDDWAQNVLAEYNARPLTTAALGGPVYYAGSLEFQAQDIAINRFAETIVNVDRKLIGRDGWFRLNIGTNATFSAGTLMQAGGFDEQFDYFLDESELCFRLQQAGCLVGYSEDVLLRHEFARGDNRTGKFSYNWRSICKNTAYFVAAYSGLRGKELEDHLARVTDHDRVRPLREALERGELGQADFEQHVQAIWAGVQRGLADHAVHYPRTRVLQRTSHHFQPFATLLDAADSPHPGGALHVCIVTKEFPPFVPGGGIGTLYYHLASELLLMGHRVSVVVPGAPESRHVRGRFQVWHTPVQALGAEGVESGFAHNMSWSVSALGAVAGIHEQQPIDVIDSALWDAEALAVSLLARHCRPPLVLRLVTPFSVAARINEWSVDPGVAAMFNMAEARLIENADAIVPISLAIAESIVEIHGVQDDDRWRLVPCGIAYWPFFDVNLGYGDISQNEGIPVEALEAEKLVLFVGRLERRKGIDLLLEAASRFLADEPSAHLLVCGRDIEGWQARSAPMHAHDIRRRIHFAGEVADSTKEKLLSRSTCLVFPSRYESFGLVPLEAFIHGVPVVACRAGAIPEVVEEGRSGLLFEPEDAQGLARCVSALLRDRELHATVSRHARERARSLGSRRSAIASVRLYRDLLEQRLAQPCRVPAAQ